LSASGGLVRLWRTGWREDGENGYLWGFFTDTERYFEYRKTRASTVPEEILGKDFGGVCTGDFYGGYNRLDLLQRCWAHLIRDAEVGAWVEALRGIYREAKEFSAASAGEAVLRAASRRVGAALRERPCGSPTRAVSAHPEAPR